MLSQLLNQNQDIFREQQILFRIALKVHAFFETKNELELTTTMIK